MKPVIRNLIFPMIMVLVTSSAYSAGGNLPLDTFPLVGSNIIKSLMARIRSETEVQVFFLKVSNVL